MRPRMATGSRACTSTLTTAPFTASTSGASEFVVGTVTQASPDTAIVVPIQASRNKISVLVGSQTGLLGGNPGSPEMTLDIFDARASVKEGDQVVTAANTFPPGLAVGEVVEAASPQSTALTARVRPFVDVESLRVVVVLAWPASEEIGTVRSDDAEESGGEDEPATTDLTGGETTDTTETPDTTTADG